MGRGEAAEQGLLGPAGAPGQVQGSTDTGRLRAKGGVRRRGQAEGAWAWGARPGQADRFGVEMPGLEQAWRV